MRMTSYADRVKLARERIGLTQQQLAERAGMTQGQISKLELGVRKKSTYTTEIANALGVSALWLAAEQGPMLGRATPPAPPSADEAEVLAIFGRLSPKNRGVALALLRALEPAKADNTTASRADQPYRGVASTHLEGKLNVDGTNRQLKKQPGKRSSGHPK